MYNRGQRFDDRDALSQNYLRSAPSYGDYLRRQNVNDFSHLRNDPMRPPDQRFPPNIDGRESWRGLPPQVQGWRREGGPPREEFAPPAGQGWRREGHRDDFAPPPPGQGWRREEGPREGFAPPMGQGWRRDGGPPREEFAPLPPGQGWRRDGPSRDEFAPPTGQGWRREGGPPREEFAPRPGSRDGRPPFNATEPSVSWRNETRGSFGDRPDTIAAPAPGSLAPDSQRSIAPDIGTVRDEVWRPSPSNWRNQSNGNPYNGMRPRVVEHRDSPKERQESRLDSDSRKRTHSSTEEKNESIKEEPFVTKARENMDISRDDSWRTPNKPKECGKIQEASPVKEEKESLSNVQEDRAPTEQSSDSTQSNEKSSLKIHKASFEDVHLFHLPEWKRYGMSRDQSKSRSEQGREDGGGLQNPPKTGSLVVHDAKFEDIHMFHLKGGEPSRHREESWAQQYKKRVESIKQHHDNRAPWPPTPHTYEDTRGPVYAERERPLPVHNYEPQSAFERRPSPEPFRGDYFSAEREYPKEAVPYNQLSAEPVASSAAKPHASYKNFFEPRQEVEANPQQQFAPTPQRNEPFNPNDYVEEFTEDDWNEVVDLVNSGGPPRSNKNSPVKTPVPTGRRTLLATAPEPLAPSTVSFFRPELPSVRGMKAPSEPQAHSGGRNNYQERAYGDYPSQQWRNGDNYEKTGDWRYSRH